MARAHQKQLSFEGLPVAAPITTNLHPVEEKHVRLSELVT